MERRKFLKTAGIGMAAGAVSMPVMAQNGPELKWRFVSAYPKSLDTVFGAGETISKLVAQATGGKFQIKVFAAGEIVPTPGVLDAVKDGTVEMGHASSYYFVGKDPTFALDCTVPFGLNARQTTAWLYEGGGMPLLREFFKEYNIFNIPCGNTGAQMGGWFRKEIKSVADLKGLKLRVAGIAGQMLSRLGVVPQQIPPADIYPSLEKGTIDAAEWVGPYDDEKLGFNKVAKYYYYPGFWEGCAQTSAYINLKQWESLPKEYQAILEAACAYAHHQMLAKYDVKNPPALRRLIASGTQLRPFPKDVMAAAEKEVFAMYEEMSASNPRFAKIYNHWKAFRAEQIAWYRVAERPFDDIVSTTHSASK